MDLYSDPPESMLITGITQWFQMPEESGEGTIPAIAVPKSQGDLWNSGYTLLLTLMFAAIGKLVTDVVITFFPLNGDGNRTAMLVAYFNTTDPMAAMGLLLTYQYKMLFNVHGKGYDAADDPKSCAHGGKEAVETESRPWVWTRLWNHKWHKVDWSAFLLALVLWTIAAGLFAASFTAGLLVPSNMLMGSVARVHPSAIFYFTQPVEEAQQQTAASQEEAEAARLARMIESQQRYQHSASTRAIGTVEQNRQVLREKVKFNTTKMLGAGGFEDGLEFDYSYEITGLDFGLQRAPELSQKVTGHCQTQFDWYDEGASNATFEQYRIWPGTPYNRTYRWATDELVPPKATFILANRILVAAEEGVSMFTIIPNVALRASTRPVSGDIWYSTMDATSNSSRTRFAVRTGRPPLSCTEKLIWKFHGLEVPTEELNKIAQVGLKLEQFWWKQVFHREFGAAPKIVQVGKAVGTSSLTSVSRGFAVNNLIETAVANATQDLEHIFLASYVAAREVVRNTALLNVERGDLQNLAEFEFDEGGSRIGNPLGKVPDERADFVLKSSEISTLSVRVMIIVPGLLVVLWLVSALRRQIFRETGAHATNTGFKSKYLARSTGFQAVHLYRFLDEETCGKRRWDGRMSSAPYISDETNENQTVPERLFQCHMEHDMDVIPVSAQLSNGKGALNLEHVPAAKYNAVIKKDLDLPVGDNLDCPWPDCRPVIRNYITPKLVPIFRHVSDTDQINKDGIPGTAAPTPETTSEVRSDGKLVAEHQNVPQSAVAGPHVGETTVQKKSFIDKFLFWWKQDPRVAGASNDNTTTEKQPVVQLTDKEKSDMNKLAAFFKTKKDLKVEPDSYDLAMTYVYRPQLTPLVESARTPKWSDISNDAVRPPEIFR